MHAREVTLGLSPSPKAKKSNAKQKRKTPPLPPLLLTKGVGRRAVLEHLVRLEPLRDRSRAGLGGDGGKEDPGDGRHRDAAVDQLGVGEPFQELRVGSQAERVEAVVAGQGAVEVGRGGVSG